MSRLRTAQCTVQRLVIFSLLFMILIPLGTIAATSVPVTVSPGRSDLNLGADFPKFASVKLSYPNSTILTNATGDLLFTITMNPPHNYFCSVVLFACSPYNVIPYNVGKVRGSFFSGIDIYIPPDFSGISITNVWTSLTNNYDTSSSLSVSRLSSSDQVAPNWWKITVYNLIVASSANNDFNETMTAHRIFLANQTQYIRLFHVTSPTTAGRYFFKAFVNGTQSTGAANFPTLVVKASKDPAYISGTLRDDGTRNPFRAGLPIVLPNGTGAQILATGFDYLGRPVSAQAFINSTAQGQYTLFGVAPGTYNITAYAAGFIPTQRPTTVSVTNAQSLDGIDIYMPESVRINATVYSKTYDGNLIPWGLLTALNGNTTTLQPRAITIRLLNLDGTIASSTPSPARITTFTNPIATTFDFSFQTEVGYDGRIPQDYANYTSGISSGDYLLRAYVTSYIQLDEVRVHVANATTSTSAIIPLIRTGFFLVTVHFKNSNATLVEDPVQTSGTLTVSAYDMQGILRAQNVTFVNAGVSRATVELAGFSNARSFGTASLFQQNYGILPGTYHITATFTSSPSFAGYANIGIRDLYYQLADVQATIGLGQAVVMISFPMFLGGGLLFTFFSIDDQLPPLKEPWAFPGANVQIQIIDSYGNVYDTNATQPHILAGRFAGNFSFFYAGLLSGDYAIVIRTLGYTQTQILHLHVILGGNSDSPIWMIQNPTIDLTLTFENEGLLSIINSTQAYAQPINHLDATPMRFEVFDDQGNFVAANQTYIPNLTNGEPTRIAHFVLAGFDKYFGDPRLVWEGFYDTTDAVRQNAGGLILYPWVEYSVTLTIRVWIDGYYQIHQLDVSVPPRGDVSVIESVDRASRISGTVIGPDFFDRARPLSWATITLDPQNNTLSSIIDVRPGNYTTSSLDGTFQLWVPEGTYGMGISLEGYVSFSTLEAISPGSDTNAQVWLDSG